MEGGLSIQLMKADYRRIRRASAVAEMEMGINYESLVAFIAVIVAVVPIMQTYNRRTRERLKAEQSALSSSRHVYAEMMCHLHLH